MERGCASVARREADALRGSSLLSPHEGVKSRIRARDGPVRRHWDPIARSRHGTGRAGQSTPGPIARPQSPGRVWERLHNDRLQWQGAGPVRRAADFPLHRARASQAPPPTRFHRLRRQGRRGHPRCIRVTRYGAPRPHWEPAVGPRRAAPPSLTRFRCGAGTPVPPAGAAAPINSFEFHPPFPRFPQAATTGSKGPVAPGDKFRSGERATPPTHTHTHLFQFPPLSTGSDDLEAVPSTSTCLLKNQLTQMHGSTYRDSDNENILSWGSA
jgi:hypothetical protein